MRFGKDLLKVTTCFYVVVTMPDHTHETRGGLSKKPVPTKLTSKDEAVLTAARQATGFTNSELIRRAVRLVKRHKEEVGNYNFLVELAA